MYFKACPFRSAEWRTLFVIPCHKESHYVSCLYVQQTKEMPKVQRSPLFCCGLKGTRNAEVASLLSACPQLENTCFFVVAVLYSLSVSIPLAICLFFLDNTHTHMFSSAPSLLPHSFCTPLFFLSFFLSASLLNPLFFPAAETTMASLAHKIFSTLKAGGEAALSTSPAHNGDTGSSIPPPPSATSSSPSAAWNERFYHVAVQGCCHGELDRIYDACAAHEQQTGKRIDVLICCGDFQAVRTAGDMDSMAVPDKFKVMGDFHKYWSAESRPSTKKTTAPYLTIFVGGNHENSDLLAQESYGGFVAPNIYYLGHSGVVTVDNFLRVVGLSGIFKDQDYDRPYPPRPYAANYGWKKGAYHVRRIEVAKLQAYLRAAQALQSRAEAGNKTTTPSLVDIFVSHDWPVGITGYGDEAKLLRIKPYFREDIQRHALGNPHTMSLLREAKPLYWVAAHLHCFFEATIAHTAIPRTASADGGSGDGAVPPPAPTQFVALDKCARGSGFLTFLDLPRSQRNSAGQPSGTPVSEDTSASAAGESTAAVSGASRIRRDPLWLEVLHVSHPYVAGNRTTHGDRDGASSRVSGSQGVFDVEDTVHWLVGRHAAGSVESSLPSTAAQSAPSTQALLEELQLLPALPLQQQQQELSTTAFTGAPLRDGTRRQNPAVGYAPRSDSHRDNAWVNQRPRVEAPAAAPQASGPFYTSTAPTPAVSLSFFEDVGTVPQPTVPAPAPPPASKAAPPTALGWFEDTAQ